MLAANSGSAFLLNVLNFKYDLRCLVLIYSKCEAMEGQACMDRLNHLKCSFLRYSCCSAFVGSTLSVCSEASTLTSHLSSPLSVCSPGLLHPHAPGPPAGVQTGFRCC